MGDKGLRRNPVSTCCDKDLQPLENKSAAESGAHAESMAGIDPDLVELIESWESLPPEIRVAIRTLTQWAGRHSREEEQDHV